MVVISYVQGIVIVVIVEENLQRPCSFFSTFLFIKMYARRDVISAYLQILLLDFSPQQYVLGVCDVQPRILTIVLKYKVL